MEMLVLSKKSHTQTQATAVSMQCDFATYTGLGWGMQMFVGGVMATNLWILRRRLAEK